jgi:hypothetical protein
MAAALIVRLKFPIPQFPASRFRFYRREYDAPLWDFGGLDPSNPRQPAPTKARLGIVTKTFPCHGSVAFVQQQTIVFVHIF